MIAYIIAAIFVLPFVIVFLWLWWASKHAPVITIDENGSEIYEEKP